jgi:CheY-like chemotaxis protein
MEPAVSRIPLVAVADAAMSGDRDRALANGFSGYVSEPIEAETLLSQVNRLLRPGLRAVASSTVAIRSTAAAGLVLVVDNSPANCSLASSTLCPFGYTVVTARSADEGLALARVIEPDIIVADVHMPDRDGYDLVRIAKAEPALRDIPILVISASVWPGGEYSRAINAGADGYLQRPLEPVAFIQEIKNHIRKASTRY